MVPRTLDMPKYCSLFLVFILGIGHGLSGFYIHSHVDKVNILFNLFDVDPKNGFLGYSELRLFQELTDPQLVLDINEYRALVKLLGSGRSIGLTLAEFNSSYFLHKNTLGTDLDRDFEKIMHLVSEMQSRSW